MGTGSRDDMEAPRPTRVDYLEAISRILTLTAAAIALVVSLVAPLLAISWSKWPFPGFMVEQTLVANSTNGSGWVGRQLGLGPPQRVIRLGGQAVNTPAEYAAALAKFKPGQLVSFFAELPDGSGQLYPVVNLMSFPAQDLARLFWLPYLAGLAYLGVGIWVYRAKGRTRPRRALAFFSFCTATTVIASFDLSSTHVLAAVYTVAIAMLGGALVSLAWRFPQEWRPVERQPWLLGLPYLVSIGLAGWGLAVTYSLGHPWDYITAWSWAYRFAALGVVVFLGMMVYRTTRGHTHTVRLQARTVLLGSALAFTPITIWFVAPLFQFTLPMDAALLLPVLILFPLSIGVAISRYRLLDVDLIVNRALLYGALTAILAGLYTIAITISQRLFVTITGEKSDAAIVITTLIVASAFVPVRDRLKGIIDRRLRDVPDETRGLRSFGQEVQAHLQMNDAGQLARRLLDEAAEALGAESGVVSLMKDGQLQPVHTHGRWRDQAWIAIPLEYGGAQYGMLALGPRLDGKPYAPEEFAVVHGVVAPVSQAVFRAVAMHVHAAAAPAPVIAPAARRNGEDEAIRVAYDPAPGANQSASMASFPQPPAQPTVP